MKWRDRILEPFRTLVRTLKNPQKIATLDTQCERMTTCEACPEYAPVSKICIECFCHMPTKVKLEESKCPLNRWKESP